MDMDAAIPVPNCNTEVWLLSYVIAAVVYAVPPVEQGRLRGMGRDLAPARGHFASGL